MEIANSFTGNAYGGPLIDFKRHIKGSELDNGSLGDFLGIDDLLDFSNEEIGGPIGEVSHTFSSATTFAENVSSNSCLDLKNFQTPNIAVGGNDSPNIAVGGNDSAELCVPCDDLAELEWLSNFVEESFSSGNASTTIFSSCSNPSTGEQNNLRVGKHQFQSASPISVLESSACSPKPGLFSPEMAVPGRARSKRSRTGLCIWNNRILSAADASANILESSCASTVTIAAPRFLDLDAFAYERGSNSLFPKKAKNTQFKVKKWLDAAQTRRCLHCATQRTPQWRTGPMGPKTLCNACGVRYKSGRLLPEYRPAASPTFVESIHSNSHKKVLEMRTRHKEGEVQRENTPFMQQHEQQQQQLASKCYGSDHGCLGNTRLE